MIQVTLLLIVFSIGYIISIEVIDISDELKKQLLSLCNLKDITNVTSYKICCILVRNKESIETILNISEVNSSRNDSGTGDNRLSQNHVDYVNVQNRNTSLLITFIIASISVLFVIMVIYGPRFVKMCIERVRDMRGTKVVCKDRKQDNTRYLYGDWDGTINSHAPTPSSSAHNGFLFVCRSNSLRM